MNNSFLLTESQAAEALGCSPHTLRSWRNKRIGPKYLRLGSRLVRYDPDALREFALTKEEYSFQKLSEEFEIYPYTGIDFIGDWRCSGYGREVFSHIVESDSCELRWTTSIGRPHCRQMSPNEVVWTFEGNAHYEELVFVPRQDRSPSGPLTPKPKPSSAAIQPSEELYG